MNGNGDGTRNDGHLARRPILHLPHKARGDVELPASSIWNVYRPGTQGSVPVPAEVPPTDLMADTAEARK